MPVSQITKLIESAVEEAREEGRQEILTKLRPLLGPLLGPSARRVESRPLRERHAKATLEQQMMASPKGKKRKNPWTNMTKEQRETRVRAMLAGRGLTPKAER